MTQELVIVRGVPGAGKSTFREREYEGSIGYEADMFFQREGEYRYDRRFIGAAHNWCFGMVAKALMEGHNRVVVSNTFCEAWELKEYLKLAHALNIKVKIVTIKGSYGSTKNLDNDSVARFNNRFQSAEEIKATFSNSYNNISYEVIENGFVTKL